MIEMTAVKKMVVSQIKFLIVNRSRLLTQPSGGSDKTRPSGGSDKTRPSGELEEGEVSLIGPLPKPSSILPNLISAADINHLRSIGMLLNPLPPPIMLLGPDPDPSANSNPGTNTGLETNAGPGIKSGQDMEGHMLHAVLSGGPGSGKTTVAMILAHIWISLGLIRAMPSSPTLESQIITLKKEIFDLKTREFSHATKIHDHMEKLVQTKTRHQKYRTSLNFRDQPYPSKAKLNQIPAVFILAEEDLDKARHDLETIYESYYNHLTPSPQQQTEEDDPYEHIEPNFIVADRSDLIGEYIGQTSIKTKAVLDKALGGVLFIDEAYNLVNPDSPRDFGHECLTMINEYMSKYPDQLIVIFAGYEEKLRATIFKSQPGLSRRCGQVFHIEPYSPNGLSRIFEQQLSKTGWSLDPKCNLVSFFQQNAAKFIDGGGSTEKLIMYCKFAYGASEFQAILDNPNYQQSPIITPQILKTALETFQQNNPSLEEEKPPPGIYL
jgi:hypothetical protein